MIEWWQSRSPRERVMLAVMMIIALPILGWLLVARPLADAKIEARADYLLALDRHAMVEAMLAPPSTATIVPLPSRLTVYLDEQASQRGFALAVNAEEAPGQVRLAIAQANGQALLGWLGELEAQGLIIDNLQISPGESGGVSLNATISERTP